MVCMCMLLTLSLYLTCLCICLGAPDGALLAARKAALLGRACEILPRLATYDSTSELWTGLRPMTPGSFTGSDLLVAPQLTTPASCFSLRLLAVPRTRGGPLRCQREAVVRL